MTPPHARKFLVLASLLLVYCIGSASAQAVNVLANPGFEEGFTERDDSPLQQVAAGWTPWHRGPQARNAPTWQLVQPEFAPATDADENAHVREGTSAQLLRSYYATWDAGLLQEVGGVRMDSWLRFSVFAWVWSSKLDDPQQSEQDGDVFVQVGIDPDGGSDGASEDIVWSEISYELYDGWREYVVITQAAAEEVSVFIRARVGQPVRNNFVWLDRASLVLDAFDANVVSALAAQQAATAMSLVTRVPLFHILQEGESLTDVARRHGVSVEAILQANNLSSQALVHAGSQLFVPEPTPEAAAAAEDNTLGRYVVRSGDTFSGIASLYGIEVAQLAQLNPGVNMSLLEVGQELVVPAIPVVSSGSRSYTVRRGDTLFDIALRFDVSAEAIARANSITVTSLLEVGQTLIIP